MFPSGGAIKKFTTNLSIFSTHVGDLDGISFEHVSLKTSNTPIDIVVCILFALSRCLLSGVSTVSLGNGCLASDEQWLYRSVKIIECDERGNQDV